MRRTMEVVRGLFDAFVDEVTDPELAAAFANNIADAMERTESMWHGLIDLVPLYATAFMDMITEISSAMARNEEGIVGFFSAIATDLIPSLSNLINVLIDIFGQSGEEFLGLLTTIIDGFAMVGETMRDNDLFNTLLEGLSNFMDSFFEVVDGLVAALGPGLGDVFTQLGLVLEAMEPLLVNFGQLFETIMQTLATVIEELRPHLGPLIDAFGRLMDALQPIIVDIIVDLADAIIGLIPTIIDILDRVTAWIERNPELTQQILMILAAVNFLIGPLGTLIGIITTVSGVVAGIAGVLGIATGWVWVIIAAIGAFVAALIWAWNNSQEFRDVIMLAWEQIRKGIEEFWALVSPIFEDITAWWQNNGDTVMEVVGIVSSALAFMGGVFVRILLNIIGGALRVMWELIKATIEVVAGWVEDSIDALRVIGDAFVDLWHGIQQFFRDIEETLSEIRVFFRETWDKIITAVRGAIDWLVEKWQWLETMIRIGATEMGEKIRGWVRGIGERLGDIRDFIGEVVGWFRDLPGRIVDAIGNVGDLLWDIGRSIIDGLIDGVESMIGSMTDTFENITSMIPDIKGPPAKDRTILVESGRMVMEGFNKGIEDEMKNVTATFRAVGPTLANTPITSPSSAGMGGRGRAQNIVVELDGRVLMRAMGDHLTDSIRLRTGVRTA